MEYIRFILGTFFILASAVVFIIEIYGNFKYDYVLNRMQAASVGDSFGIALALIGLICYCGFTMYSAKLALVLVFLWFSSPVCAHIVAKLETETNEKLEEECEVEKECRS